MERHRIKLRINIIENHKSHKVCLCVRVCVCAGVCACVYVNMTFQKVSATT